MPNQTQRETPATEAALGQGQVASTDHIITISTASITEAYTDDDTEQLKQQRLLKQPTQLPHNVVSPTEIAAPTPLPASGAASTPATSKAKKKLRALCQLSQLVSFQNNIADVHHRRGRRLHGLQLPLHPLQLFGWLVLVLFGLASYLVLIPAFSVPFQGPLYGLITGLYIVHIASHLAALLTDPADKELRRVHRNDRIVPEFDRTKHAHVIENGRCHLCNIRTSSPRTKHCSVCNKCVGKFDHHCKWLNHCIGSRNYVAFLMCVVSAVVATLVIVAAVIAQIVLYYFQPEWLSFYWCKTTSSHAVFNGTDFINLTLSMGNGTLMLLEDQEQTEGAKEDLYTQLENVTLPTLMQNLSTMLEVTLSPELTTSGTIPTMLEESNHTASTPTVAGIGVNETIFLVLIGILGLLAAISAGLLLHLCFFHIYISFLGLTTYEYIRNHRQAQEAKAKHLLSTNAATMLPKNGVHFSPTQQQPHNNPSRHNGSECGQIFCCSSVRHPNALAHETDYFEARKLQQTEEQLKLHCCANSREFHQRAHKAYYVCSLLDEHSVSPYDESPNLDQSRLQTFHCCSSFAAGSLQRRVSAATSKATLVSDVEAAAAAASLSVSARGRPYLQYTEQCTFCTFRIRSPLVTKRTGGSHSGSHISNSTRILATHSQPSMLLRHSAEGSSSTDTVASTATTVTSAGGGVQREREHQRCCMKSISKHQRWRRKWNCCTSVPDSPDVPNDLIAALAYRHQQQQQQEQLADTSNKINAAELPVQFIRTLNGDAAAANAAGTASAGTIKSQSSSSNSRTWPVARLRHMMRMLGRYRRPRCRHHHGHVAAAEQHHPYLPNHPPHHTSVKQNQIRPLQLQGRGVANGGNSGGYYDSSTPQPPSSCTPTASELSSEMEHSTSDGSLTSAHNNELLILPTSVIRDDSVTTYTLTLPPALPPPTRRKMPNPTDLKELAETLGFASPPSGPYTPNSCSGAQQQRLPVLGNVYRRQRRKHFLRTRSPTLSPIHESGLSNPTSPQPCRHSINSNNNNGSSNCSPNVARSSVLVQNLCGIAGETLRKAASNSSLQSVSSNSSST
ncbi:uncharacterized protein LOC115631211 [Scaptodrosophila lebanonensis]|uniref:Uncharacterized protein LOC115631211 n=1 Tax=Drosophila lebanonensis TaxID=7225 RepID=A0A6J2U5D6_DROLE|nr:uncharacterized protein LOC115631211 [Scaptodrosophila lebanonensis]